MCVNEAQPVDLSEMTKFQCRVMEAVEIDPKNFSYFLGVLVHIVLLTICQKSHSVARFRP